MKLEKILNNIDYKLIKGSLDTEVSGLYYDSRKVTNGSAFICLSGTQVDGHDYIKSAIEENKGEIVNTIIGKLEKENDFEDLIIKKINEFSLEDVEKMTINIAKNELKHIEYIGAVLGAFIGVIQYLLITII